MKTLLIYGLAIGLLTVGMPRADAQTPFVNLNFELAPFPLPNQFAILPTPTAMPGWTAYINDQVADTVWYNGISFGASAISLHGPGSTPVAPQGNYWVLVQAASSPEDDPPGIAFLGQTGTIPADALSITFLARGGIPGLTFGGEDIPLESQGGFEAHGRFFTVLAGDISSFAGHTGELRFGGTGAFDDVRFSTEMVPEPSGIALIGLASVLAALGWRRRKEKEGSG